MARVDERKRRAIADAYQQGLPMRKICADYATTDRTVHRIIRDMGIPLRDRQEVATQNHLERLRKERAVIRMHREGLRAWQIQRRTGIGFERIMELISRDEAENKPIDDLSKVRALMGAGWRIDDIAEEFQVTRQRAADAMRTVLETIGKEHEAN